MLKITTDIYEFEPWSDAVTTYNRINDAGLLDTLDDELEFLYPDGISETGLNDLLRYDADYCYDLVGLRSESAIREEIEEAEEERDVAQSDIDTMMTDYNEEAETMTEEEARDLWESTYAEDIDDLRSTVDELNEKIDELKDELENL